MAAVLFLLTPLPLIYINPNIIEIIIGIIETLNTIPFAYPTSASLNKTFTIFNSTKSANNPDNIPNGIPINPNAIASKITFFFICFL